MNPRGRRANRKAKHLRERSLSHRAVCELSDPWLFDRQSARAGLFACRAFSRCPSRTGATLVAATRTIEAVVNPQRVYCALFAEETRSVHFHLFPRSEWLLLSYSRAHPEDTEISGPRLMDWARRTFQTPIAGMGRDETFEKIRTRLTSSMIAG